MITCSLILVVTCLTITVRTDDAHKKFQSHPNWKLLDRGEDCGLSSSDRIIGGKEAALGQFPWIARLGHDIGWDGGLGYDCGGSIINDRYILTAAHCIFEINGTVSQVRLGEHDANTDPDCRDGFCAPPVQDIDVEETTCHHAYDRDTVLHDICLLRLAAPIQFHRFVYPICLPAYDFFQSNHFVGRSMEVAGWGVTKMVLGYPRGSDLLLTLSVPVVNHTACASQYHTPITAGQICAGGVGGQDTCGGDSGGPLMCSESLDAPPRYFVIGIVSYGLELCASGNIPSIYTNVFQYMDWILDNVRK